MVPQTVLIAASRQNHNDMRIAVVGKGVKNENQKVSRKGKYKIYAHFSFLFIKIRDHKELSPRKIDNETLFTRYMTYCENVFNNSIVTRKRRE